MIISKYASSLPFLLITAALIAGPGCESEDEDEHSSKISLNNTDDSHNTGRDCMGCHNSGHEYYFKLAGSVYNDPTVNPTPIGNLFIDLVDSGTSAVVKTVEVDNLGNFYTTEDINWGPGLYPLVRDSSGNNSMQMGITVSSISNGSCNASGCHSNPATDVTSTGRIYLAINPG